MPKSLFERLKAPQGGNTRAQLMREYERYESNDETLKSITNNLSRLLNSRQGQSSACLDYGILDVTQIIYGLEESEDAAERAIQRCIEQYEPRLTRIRVKRVEDPTRPLSVSFVVSARLVSDKSQTDVWFETMVSSSGRVRVVRG